MLYVFIKATKACGELVLQCYSSSEAVFAYPWLISVSLRACKKKKKQSRVLGALRSVCSSTGQALDAAAMPDFGSAWASQVLQSHKTCDSACRNQSTKVYLWLDFKLFLIWRAKYLFYLFPILLLLLSSVDLVWVICMSLFQLPELGVGGGGGEGSVRGLWC